MSWRSVKRQYERDKRRENEIRTMMNMDEERYHREGHSAELYEIQMRQQRKGIEAKVRREFRVELMRFVLNLACAVFVVWSIVSQIPALGIVQPPSWPWAIVGAVLLESTYARMKARRT